LKNSESFKNIETSILALNGLTDGNSNTFVESAAWADDIKGPGMDFW